MHEKLLEIIRAHTAMCDSIEDATGKAFNQLLNDQELFNEVAKEAVLNYVRSSVSHEMYRKRSRLKRESVQVRISTPARDEAQKENAQASAERKKAALEVQGRQWWQSVLGMPYNGRKLGDYTGAGLTTIIDSMQAQEKGCRRMRVFVEMIQKQVKPQQLVKNAISPEDADALYEQASRSNGQLKNE